MQTPTLEALAAVGVRPNAAGHIRLYHATTESAADTIIAEKCLRPTAPGDPAQRMLLRGRGYVFLASSPSIGDDLVDGRVVLSVEVATEDLPSDPYRAGWGDPPRVELQVEIPLGQCLKLVSAERWSNPEATMETPPAAEGSDVEAADDAPA